MEIGNWGLVFGIGVWGFVFGIGIGWIEYWDWVFRLKIGDLRLGLEIRIEIEFIYRLKITF